VHGVVFSGRRYDTGDKADYLRTVVRLACDRPDLGPEFTAWLREFVAALDSGDTAREQEQQRPQGPEQVRAQAQGQERVAISAVDPLNLAGILTPGDKVPRLPGNRLLFEGGVPIAVQSGGDIRYLRELDATLQWEVKNLLIRKQRPASYIVPPPGLS